MLKQDTVPDPPVSVASARVTPDELTAALAAIEARRQSDAKTIPIDQAVSELNLDSTPDEIWAEVQKQRAKAAMPQTLPAQALPVPVNRRSRRGWPVVVAPAIALWIVGNAVVSSVGRHGHHRPSTAAPILRPLSLEPDGKTVYADDAALVQISEGKPASQVTISENASGNCWPLIKLEGHVYLQGHIARTDTLQSLQGKPFNVFNDSDSGELEGVATSHIRLRVDKTPLLKSGGDSDYLEVTVPDFQPDPLTTLSDGR